MADGDKKIIMIVEDDPALVAAYEVKFAQEGYELLIATDGKQALDMLPGKVAHVVLLDLMLPEVSGFDVLSAMKKDSRWQNVPVIILTNLSDDKDVAHGKELGASDYLVKANMNIADILSRVKQELK